MRLMAVFIVVLLQGCASGLLKKPVQQADQWLDLPELWTSAGNGNQGRISTGWVDTLEDPELKELVAEAIKHNRNLKVAGARLEIAKQGTVIGRAIRLPSISASGSGSRTGVRNQDATGDLQSWREFDDYGLSLNLSWEVDLWGRLRNLEKASIEDYAIVEADFRGARLSVAANAARAWYNLITAGRQVELAGQTRDSFERNRRITERNYKAGDTSASALDVQFSRNNVAQADRSMINRVLSRDDARRSLEVLLGRYPAALIQGRDDLPVIHDVIPAGLPSELLLRRPDLAAAAANIRASSQRADAARKDLLPAIRLSGRGSTVSDQLSDLISDPTSVLWNVAASVSQPVFQGGELTARARQALARNEAAVEFFMELALQAFREVESTLARELSLVAQQAFLETELAQAKLAESQASRDYSEGIVGILEVLEAQRRAFNARNSMISLQNERLQNRIDMHLALGGDFETPISKDAENLLESPGKPSFSLSE